jgi:hypothetical protein
MDAKYDLLNLEILKQMTEENIVRKICVPKGNNVSSSELIMRNIISTGAESKEHNRKYSFVNWTIQLWNQLPVTF